jgi:TolA-binding protein
MARLRSKALMIFMSLALVLFVGSVKRALAHPQEGPNQEQGQNQDFDHGPQGQEGDNVEEMDGPNNQEGDNVEEMDGPNHDGAFDNDGVNEEDRLEDQQLDEHEDGLPPAAVR